MESLSCILLSMAVLAASLLVSKLLARINHPLPGPKPWPIIGNLNLIGPLPHRSLHILAKQYGQLMQLKFGSLPVAVASSSEMAKQILQTNDRIFASRSPTAAGKYANYNYCNVAWAPYGPHWRQAKRIYLTELFSSKRVESYEYIRVEEIHAFVSRINCLSGKPVPLKDHLSRATLSVITRIVLGKKYFSEPEARDQAEIVKLEEFQEMLDELFLLSSNSNIGDWVPWLSFLDLEGNVKKMKALSKKFDRFLNHVIDEHRAKREAAGTNFMAKDMVDLLLQLSDDPNLEVQINSDSVKGFMQELISGATDTSATSVEWAMSELMKQPYLIEKATEELDEVIGKDRWVEERDFPQLPYIDAILKEAMRLHPVGALLAPRLALEDCKVAGYEIRKGTTALINAWSIGRDPQIWDDPEKFHPERFLAGKVIDVKGQHFELLPFGSGRRMCPGYPLGLKMIRSMLANLLHGFNWKLPENMKTEELSMDEVYGLATQRKFPLVAITEPRLPFHLYQ